MSHEHIRPTRTGAWCVTVPNGTAKMEIPARIARMSVPGRLAALVVFSVVAVFSVACGPTVDLKKGLQIDVLSSGWADAGVVGGQNKLVPTVTFTLKNISDQKLVVLQINASFRRANEKVEWRSELVPRYQRRSEQVDAAILGVCLSGTNTRRIKGALAPLLRGGPLSKDPRSPHLLWNKARLWKAYSWPSSAAITPYC